MFNVLNSVRLPDALQAGCRRLIWPNVRRQEVLNGRFSDTLLLLIYILLSLRAELSYRCPAVLQIGMGDR